MQRGDEHTRRGGTFEVGQRLPEVRRVVGANVEVGEPPRRRDQRAPLGMQPLLEPDNRLEPLP